MKVKGNGRAKVLTQSELDRLFERGFVTPRDKLLFATTYYCACRVSEALALTVQDIAGGTVTLRKSTTKGKTATRTLPMHPKLNEYLEVEGATSTMKASQTKRSEYQTLKKIEKKRALIDNELCRKKIAVVGD